MDEIIRMSCLESSPSSENANLNVSRNASEDIRLGYIVPTATYRTHRLREECLVERVGSRA